MEVKTILITQARSGSTRLPGKILMKINGESLLDIHLKRLSKCNNVSKIIVATTDKPEDKVIYDYAIDRGLNSFRGSESDVLDRFYQAVRNEKPDWIVRVTSDCPLIDPFLVDKLINFAHNNNRDYCSNTLIENYPDGQDIEVFKFSALELAWENANLPSDREHVTLYIRNNSDFKRASLFTALNYPCDSNYSMIRMTVDESRDFDLIKVLINNLGTDKTWLEYTNHIIKNDLNTINNSIIRNEGFLKSIEND
ncbi:glycosyltransferase family protein [Polaribacter sp.]|nr:glycosyltransferase family protein [Polaribacter sp.]MDC1519846.1 glycosyltransferase family protein [Polaribacter sp.]